MKKLTLLLVGLFIFSVSSIVNARICNMEYIPVCSVEGKTYSNMCTAGDKEIAYKGECKENFMSKEDRKYYHLIQNRVDEKVKTKISKILQNFKKSISKLNKAKQEKILDNVIFKVNTISDKLSRDTKKNQIKYYIFKYIAFELEIIKNGIK